MPALTREQLKWRHVFAPRGSAKRIFTDRSPEILVSGPAGTGKSRAQLEKLHLCALKYPGMRALIVRKVQKSLTSTALVTFTKFVIKEVLESGEVSFYGGGPQEPAGYRYKNGSFIAIGGMDEPSKIMSSEYDMIYAQEATELTIDDWEAMNSRLRNGVMPYQQLIADCNPWTPTHWLKRRCDAGICKIYYSLHTDNPRLYRDDGRLTREGDAYLARLRSLTGVRRQRLYEGKWVAAEGMIYADVWDDATHVIEPRKLSPQWRRVWSIDFGYRNPMVIQCWAIDPEGRAFLEWEFYRTGTLVEDAVKMVFEHVSVPDETYVHPEGEERYPFHGRIWRHPRPDAIVCDHDAEDRATFERRSGLTTIAATKTVSDGLQAVAERMKPAEDGLPRLFIMRDVLIHPRDPELEQKFKPCCTLEEIPGYVWKTPIATTAASERRSHDEEPLKLDDHGMDAKRYFVMQEDVIGVPSMRWL